MIGPQYSYFDTNYSFGNMAYLYYQGAREIIGKYSDWKNVGRWVLKGSRAYEIIRPVFRQIVSLETGEEEHALSGFVPSRCIFTLSQTGGPELPPK
jgi:hypothetical protein